MLEAFLRFFTVFLSDDCQKNPNKVVYFDQLKMIFQIDVIRNILNRVEPWFLAQFLTYIYINILAFQAEKRTYNYGPLLKYKRTAETIQFDAKQEQQVYGKVITRADSYDETAPVFAYTLSQEQLVKVKANIETIIKHIKQLDDMGVYTSYNFKKFDQDFNYYYVLE